MQKYHKQRSCLEFWYHSTIIAALDSCNTGAKLGTMLENIRTLDMESTVYCFLILSPLT